MITRIEAYRYRCFDRLDIRLKEYQVLAGANGSGKSTLMDIPLLLGDIVSRGLVSAFLDEVPTLASPRAQSLQELVHLYRDDWFGLALEAKLPEFIKRDQIGWAAAGKRSYDELMPDRIRYELRCQIFNQNELHVVEEYLYFIPETVDVVNPMWAGKSGTIRRPIIQRAYGEPAKFRGEFLPRIEHSIDFEPDQVALANLIPDKNAFAAALWFRSYLQKGMICYNPQWAQLRQASRPGLTRSLRPDGINLPWLVLELKKRPDMFKSWVEHVKLALPHVTAIDAVEREDDHYAYLKLTYRGGYTVPSSGLSDGTVHILAYTILSYLANVPEVICIEEPENGIHPRAIELVLQSFQSLYDSQVFVSSHSPIVLASTKLEDVIVLRTNAGGQSKAVRGPEHPYFTDWKGGADLGMLFASEILG